VAVATSAAAGEPEAHALPTLVGEGIAGWVAAERVAQNLPDVARDPRAGAGEPTDAPRPDESMLVAPMLHGDQVVGVLSLAKPGLQQFGDDELRLLTIFASFAAQALSNAEATERLQRQAAALERQLRSQRELLGVTESILTMLEPREIIERIAERLGEVVAYDNISIEVWDAAERRLRPVTARGVHAADYLVEWEPGEVGLATWVVENDEPVLVEDQAADPRVRHFASTGPIHGSLIVVPLHDRDGATGVLTVERLDPGDVFGGDEFELVKLFAGQVSIALQNAEVYRAVEVRARTDDLTRLLNRGTFEERLRRSVAEGDTFSLILLDLDGFRQVNNVLGHQAGDRFLRDVAAALRSAGRETDLVFRYGGDEFCYLLPGSDEAGARHVAERVLKAIAAISEPGTAWAAVGTRVTASVGWATHPVDGCTADELLLAADRATYVAKRRGGNRIATAEEGLALAAEVRLQEPTPVDRPSLPAA
jgi:diguanylate cyclase (GGDEF)-like protein